MLPLGDDNDDALGGTAYVNLGIIALNVLVYIYQVGHPAFSAGYAMVPHEIATGIDLVSPTYVDAGDGTQFSVPQAPGPSPIWLTLFSAMFMHASLVHIGGNMLFLYIFGDNIERAFGHVRYLVFYLVCGLAANLAMVVANADSTIPNLGASGAIAGVLAGYLVLFPGNRVRVLLGYWLTTVPAIFMIGLWILLQFFSEVNQLGTGAMTGVAYVAHIGGFLTGLLIAFALRPMVMRRMPARYSGFG